MFIRDLKDCDEFVAGDDCTLRELLHPDKAPLDPVLPRQAVYIPPNAAQYIRNTGAQDLVFICLVDPAWRKEDETVW